MLQAELAKGNVYTQAQYKQKVENLDYNHKVLLKLNKEGNMEDFQYKLHLLKSPADLYFERFELIEELVVKERERAAKPQEETAKEHTELIETWKKQRTEFDAKKKLRLDKQEKLEEERKLKEIEDEKERLAKGREAMQEKAQAVHDGRQKYYRRHFKKVKKYLEEHKDILSRTPVYKVMESKFQEEFVLPEIADRVKKLEEIRESRKPMDIDDLNKKCETYTEKRKKEIRNLKIKMARKLSA